MMGNVYKTPGIQSVNPPSGQPGQVMNTMEGMKTLGKSVASRKPGQQGDGFRAKAAGKLMR